jgi:hypothetical protein
MSFEISQCWSQPTFHLHSGKAKELRMQEYKDNVMPHPKRALMIEATFEKEIAESPEAKPLQDAIIRAVQDYSDFLERHGLIWEDRPTDADPFNMRLKAQALVVTLNYGEGDILDIELKDGALDRVYGDGVNPDPYGSDADPPLPSKS